MDSNCYNWPVSRAIFIYVVLLTAMCQKGLADAYGIRSLHANIGVNATFRFTRYTLKIQDKRCEVKQYDILVLGTQQFKRIYTSKSGNGTTVCTEKCSVYKNRGSMLVDDQDVTFTLHNITPADQSQYCLHVKCSGQNDIVNCNLDAVRLVPVEPVKWVKHTQVGSAHTVKLGETVRGNCVADGNPAPNIKIVNIKTNKIIHEGHTNNLSYVFRVTQRRQQVLLCCEATNNPEKSAVTQLLKVDVKYRPFIKSSSSTKIIACEGQVVELWAYSNGSPIPEVTIKTADGKLVKKSMGQVRVNVSQPGVFLVTADNGITPNDTRLIKVIAKHNKTDIFQSDGSSEDCSKERIYMSISFTFNALFCLYLLFRWFYPRCKRNKNSENGSNTASPARALGPISS